VCFVAFIDDFSVEDGIITYIFEMYHFGSFRKHIFATAGSERKLAFIESIGVTNGINYKKENFRDKVIQHHIHARVYSMYHMEADYLPNVFFTRQFL